MANNDPKNIDDEILDDEDFDLEDFDEDDAIEGEAWDESDDGDDAQAGIDEIDAAAENETLAAKRQPKAKKAKGKSGTMILVLAGLGASALLITNLMFTAKPPTEQELADATIEAQQGRPGEITELGENVDVPPMPAPINSVEDETAQPDVLTPLPGAASLEDTKLADLNAPQETPEAASAEAVSSEEAPALEAPTSAIAYDEGTPAPAEEPIITEAPAPTAPEEIAPPVEAEIAAEPAPVAAPAETADAEILNEKIAEVESLSTSNTELSEKNTQLSEKLSTAETKAAEAESKAQEQAKAIAELEKQVAALSKEEPKAEVAPEPVAEKTPEPTPEAVKPALKNPPASVVAKPKAEVTKPTAKAEQPRTAAVTWTLRSAQPGKALVSAKGSNDFINVAVGDTVPGLGRITSIARENGRWVVRGSDGVLSQ